MYAKWPDAFDAMECAAVVGTRVLVRSAARADGDILTRLNYAVVKVRGFNGEDKSWSSVETSTGIAGWMRSDFLYSPLHMRAIFQMSDGRWLMRALVAGD